MNNESPARSPIEDVPATVMTKLTAVSTASVACRSALVKSPAASRAALAKHHASIDPALAKALEVVGGYTNEDGHNSLHESVVNDNTTMVQILIEVGENVGSMDHNGATPLDLATSQSCRDILEHHLAVLAAITANTDSLVSAAIAHSAALSAFRVPAPPTPTLKLRSYQLDPSFLWAPPAARAAVVAWARDAYAVQLAANTYDFTDLPDDCAGDVLEFLNTSMPRAEMLHVTAHCSSPEAHAWVRAVVAAAVAAKATAELGPAAEEGNLATVQDCLRRGADIDVQGTNACTALMLASYESYPAIVKLLIDAGADMNAKNTNGATALILASIKNRSATVELLLEAGADMDAMNNNGSTALMFASMRGCNETVNLLLKAGADKNVTNKIGGYTALIVAAEDGRTAAVQLLLEAGADKNVKNKEGKTALACAQDKGHTEVVALLKR